jgi:hypothetical protein
MKALIWIFGILTGIAAIVGYVVIGFFLYIEIDDWIDSIKAKIKQNKENKKHMVYTEEYVYRIRKEEKWKLLNIWFGDDPRRIYYHIERKFRNKQFAKYEELDWKCEEDKAVERMLELSKEEPKKESKEPEEE